MKKILTLVIFTIVTMSTYAQYKVGDKAKDFSLKNIDGKMVSLADFDESKGFIVIFTCNHCPYAIKYEDRIIALNEVYSKKGYPVIAINPNDPEVQPEDSYDNMKIRAEKKGFNFPYLFDETQEVFKRFGATRTPHVFILNKEEGKLVVRYIGAIDDNYKSAAAVTQKYVEDAISALENGQNPEPELTKAIGCSIKVKK
jgi:peroxiredoxin